MNYLETGLPHTDFIRRKSDFSPPRFIPLCKLGRKYRGLESLTQREAEVLVKRLSEPKRNPEIEDPTPVLTQIRQNTKYGSGRFVGQKKMSSFEIEKMVDRLYSRRATKDYAFVDETVEAEDIINMTNRNDDSSDSESEAEEDKTVKDRKNSLLRRENGFNASTEYHVDITRDNSTTNEPKPLFRSRISTEKREISATPSFDMKTRPKTSVSFQRGMSFTENRKSYDDQSGSDKQVHDKTYVSRPKLKRSTSSPGNRSQSSPNHKSQIFAIQRLQASPSSSPKIQAPPSPSPRLQETSSPTTRVQVPNQRPVISKSEVLRRLEQIEEDQRNFVSQTFNCTPISHGAELTRPSSLNFMTSINTQNVSPAPKDNKLSTKIDKEMNKNVDKDSELSKSSSSTLKTLISPRQKISKSDSGKPPRFAVEQCDELLIDRVATYNRSPRLRCK